MEKDDIEQSITLLVIGGSSGSLDIVLKVLSGIQENSKVSIVVVMHRKNSSDSVLSDLLTYRSSLPVVEVEDKERIRPSQVYLVPPDYHLLFEKEQVLSLDDSEKINFSRPSIDVTFESAAETYGAKVIGILLSGANADGTAGLESIHAHGGITIVQRPETASSPYMPEQALLHAHVDFQMNVEEMIRYINEL